MDNILKLQNTSSVIFKNNIILEFQGISRTPGNEKTNSCLENNFISQFLFLVLIVLTEDFWTIFGNLFLVYMSGEY